MTRNFLHLQIFPSLPSAWKSAKCIPELLTFSSSKIPKILICNFRARVCEISIPNYKQWRWLLSDEKGGALWPHWSLPIQSTPPGPLFSLLSTIFFFLFIFLKSDFHSCPLHRVFSFSSCLVVKKVEGKIRLRKMNISVLIVRKFDLRHKKPASG